jgi:hypothetical protein
MFHLSSPPIDGSHVWIRNIIRMWVLIAIHASFIKHFMRQLLRRQFTEEEQILGHGATQCSEIRDHRMKDSRC